MLFRSFSILIIALIGMSSPCSAMVIDDFEEGAFSLMTNATTSGNQLVTPGLHCVADHRYVTLASSSAAITLFAQLNVPSLNPDNEMQCVFTGPGRLELEYLPNPTDLTAGGIFGRLDVNVTAVDPANFDITLELEDVGGVTAMKSQVIPGIGLSSFFLTDFPAIDPTQILGIRIVFTAQNQGDLHVSDIRMRKVAAAVVNMDALNVVVTGPPYPTPPIQFEAGPISLPPDPVVPVELLSLSLTSAQDLTNPPLPLAIKLLGADSGGGVGMAGSVGQIAVFWDGGGTFPASSFFDISTLVEAVGDIQPCSVPPDPVIPGTKAFQVFFQIDHTVSGHPAGSTDHVLTFEIGNQPLVFADATLSQPPDPCIDEFHTQVILRDVSAAPSMGESPRPTIIDPSEPLFTISIMADHSGTGALVAVTPGQEPRLPLVEANPSIMRSHTTLRMNAAITGSIDLMIHDVLGRLVTRLRVSESGEVVWKGMDEWGKQVPAGVYLAHVPDLGAYAATRIIKLR